MIKKAFAQVIIANVLLVLVLSAYSAWFVMVSKKSADVATLAAQIRDKHKDSDRITAIKNSLTELGKDEQSAEQYFVSTSEVVPYLGSLEDLGKSIGTKVEVVSVSADTAKPKGHLNLSLKITGPFTAVIKTLGAIEYQPYDTVIKSLALDTSLGNASSTPVWTAAAVFVVGTTPVAKTNVVAPPIPVATTTVPSATSTP